MNQPLVHQSGDLAEATTPNWKEAEPELMLAISRSRRSEDKTEIKVVEAADLRHLKYEDHSRIIEEFSAGTEEKIIRGSLESIQYHRELHEVLLANVEESAIIIEESELQDNDDSGGKRWLIEKRLTAKKPLVVEELRRPGGPGSEIDSRSLQCREFDRLATALDQLEFDRNEASDADFEMMDYAPLKESRTKSQKILLVCNAYPSDSQIYRNGFIHSRVEQYIKSGLGVEVFYLHEPATECKEYIYRGVRVHLGNADHYYEFVRDNIHDAYLVHFASRRMILPLEELNRQQKVVIWIHGFEAESWHRRWFNFLESPESIDKILEMKDSYYADQKEFMANVFENREGRFHFVNVSSWFKTHIVEPDAGVAFNSNTSSIIPNFVDGDYFNYVPKKPEARMKILAIRPYASHKYANDLTVDAITILSEKPWFRDLEFTLYGHGKMFKEVTSPLRGYKNVHLLNRFLGREEIRLAHRRHGVFLSPTRFDSQGVSANEAMASGLVPISNSISAIPEFITHFETGLLAQPESAEQIAKYIELLYFDSELFTRLSRGAARSIRKIAGYSESVGKEIDLIDSAVELGMDAMKLEASNAD